jgi:hypothetical protein
MSDTCGPMYEMPLAQYDPDERCWKTSEATSLWALPMSSPTLPAWGYLHDGALFEQPTPARLTTAHDFSSLPTPVADHSRGLPQTGTDFQSLPNVAMSFLPTPRAQNGEPRNQTIYKREGPQNLENALALLPTPAVNDMGAGKDPQAWKEWAARQKAADGRPAPHGKSLEQEALKMLPTPTAGDHVGTGYAQHWQELTKADGRHRLRDAAALIGGTTHPPLNAGSTLSDDQHQPQLFTETTATA